MLRYEKMLNCPGVKVLWSSTHVDRHPDFSRRQGQGQSLRLGKILMFVSVVRRASRSAIIILFIVIAFAQQ